MQLAAPEIDPEYLYKCAALLLKCKNYSYARDLYRVLLEKDIKNAEALKGYGICFYAEKNTAAARRCFLGYKAMTRSEVADFWLQVAEFQANPSGEMTERIKAIASLAMLLEFEGAHLELDLKTALRLA